ncbi:VTT domain-containing protein [Halobium salinum]|uniref:VTT domain-containing protein n=1 Tax=Halobium salinum TaxID=1364940 RepID=A0ABD5PA32_9EURY|nr:VTT domain-containing protein [Halobium salinum]
MNRRTRLAAGVATLALVALLAWLVSPAVALSGLRWLAGRPALFGLVLLVLAVVRPFLAWPTTLLAVAAGYGYGLAGFPVALGLMTITAVPPYGFGRRARGQGGRVSATAERFVAETGGVRSVAATRLLPAPSDVVSVAAGVAGVRLRALLVGTALGEVPWAALGTLAGATVGTLTAGTLARVADPRVVVGAATLGALALAGPVYRMVRATE